VRELRGWQRKAVGAWLVCISLFELYTATFGIFEPRIQRGVHLLFLLPAAFLLFPARSGRTKSGFGILDALMATLALFPPLYIIYFHDALTQRMEFVDRVTSIQLVLGALMIVLMIEAVRRAVVPAMAILIAAFIAYLFVAPYLPGVLYSRSTSLSGLIELEYLITDAGIFGAITGVSATFVALFVIFGAFLENTKAGQFFTDMACRVAGRGYGGPAKIAVISSGLFGSISGVAAANVYATGTFTIPMMKKLGYRAPFAGAVEAAAATGGMLMPPVMGAGAFVMAEITGIPYITICIAAALGAILYYASLVARVHFQARKRGIRGMGDVKPVSYKQLALDSYLLVPIILLVVLLVKGFSPFLAANAAIGLTFVISFLKKDTRMTPARLWETLCKGGVNMVMIALACAGADMVVSIVTHTGLALGVAAMITNWSGGYLLPAMVLIMITCLILGMGLPCTPAYIIAITIGGPAMLNMGCDMLSSNLFVFYFAILAGVTPPVCVPAYCAASIAQADPMLTGFEAFKLAILGFFIPYVFVMNPALLMKGSLLEIYSVLAAISLAILCFASSLSAFLTRPLKWGERFGIFLVAVGLTILAASREIVNLPMIRIALTMVLLFMVSRPLLRRIRMQVSAGNATPM
jgi:TRAP transporter 4TM/12TM fusion protein